MFRIGDKIQRTFDKLIFTYMRNDGEKMVFVKDGTTNFSMPQRITIKPETLMEDIANGKYERVE